MVQVDYELHTLGWKAFQHLSASILGEIWGQTIQTFSDVHDGGRDGAFHGTWKLRSKELLQGSFTVQCKFIAKPGALFVASDLREELPKAQRLAARGLADNYLLLTNASLTATTEHKLREQFLAIPGIRHFAGYGGEWIAKQIRE